MWVICGIIVGKQFNVGDVAVLVIGFKLVDLGSGKFSQISLLEMINNKNNNICKPLNLIDTIERWRRCKRSDLRTELCVNNRCLLFRRDIDRWMGLYIKLPLFNSDGSFYFFDAPIFRINDISKSIGVYMELATSAIKLIYKGYDVDTGMFTGVKSIYKFADNNRQFGMGNSVHLENLYDIRNLWKRDGVIERLGNFICRLECANRFDVSVLNGFTFAELRGCSNVKITLPPTVTRVEVIGDTVAENIELWVSKGIDINILIGIISAFIKSPIAYEELRSAKSIDGLISVCRKYRLRLMVY